MIEFGTTRYHENQVIVIAARVGESRNPPGFWETDCRECGDRLSIDMRSQMLVAEDGVPVICMECAARNHPNYLVHLADGTRITMGEAVDKGIVKVRKKEGRKADE